MAVWKPEDGFWNGNFEKDKALEDELLENVGGGADKIRGGTKAALNTVKVDDQFEDKIEKLETII